MKVTALSIALLSACSSIYTSDSKPQYAFSDYDKNVFTNHVTGKVELVYPTPLVESFRLSDEPLLLTKWEVEQLAYPALTRIVFKQQALESRFCNRLSGLMSIGQQEEEKRVGTTEAEYRRKLAGARCEAEGLLKQHSETITTPYIKVSPRCFMLIVQYAARNIKHYAEDRVGIIVSAGDESQQVVVYGPVAALLEKYRAYEQQ